MCLSLNKVKSSYMVSLSGTNMAHCELIPIRALYRRLVTRIENHIYSFCYSK